MSLVAIATGAAVECERQQVGIRQLGYLLNAHAHACFYGMRTPGDIISLAVKVEPYKNLHGFRKTPVTFQNGGSSAMASEISRLVDQLCESVHMFIIDPSAEDLAHSMAVTKDQLLNALVKEFLWIHPFVDGNGRVAWLLYNYLMGTLDNPLPLPDFNF